MSAGGLFLAFAAGIVSVATPCVLPLLPGYLTAVSGIALADLERGGMRTTARVAPAAVRFVLGFALVFVALGLLVGALGGAFEGYGPEVQQVAGIIVVAMGFALMGLLPLPARLGVSLAPGVEAAHHRGSAMLLGAAFAACATPCVGPVLASVLAIGSAGGDALRSGALLAAYAAGLALPLLAMTVAFTHALGAMRFLRDRYAQVRFASGVLLVALGLLLFSERVWIVRVYFNRVFDAVGLDRLPAL